MPDRGDEIVLSDDAIAVLQKKQLQIEDLWLDSNKPRTAAQLAAVAIKHTIGKEQLHS